MDGLDDLCFLTFILDFFAKFIHHIEYVITQSSIPGDKGSVDIKAAAVDDFCNMKEYSDSVRRRYLDQSVPSGHSPKISHKIQIGQ